MICRSGAASASLVGKGTTLPPRVLLLLPLEKQWGTT
jgi:hypothetical protein